MQSDGVSASFTDYRPAPPASTVSAVTLEANRISSRMFLNQNHFDLPTHWIKKTLLEYFHSFSAGIWKPVTQHNPPHPSQPLIFVINNSFSGFKQFLRTDGGVFWSCLCYVIHPVFIRKSKKATVKLLYYPFVTWYKCTCPNIHCLARTRALRLVFCLFSLVTDDILVNLR